MPLSDQTSIWASLLPGPLYPALPKLPLRQEILKLCLPLVVTALETFNLLHGSGEQQEFPLQAPRTLKVRQEDQEFKASLGYIESLSLPWAP